MKPEFQRRVQRYGWDKAVDYYEPSWKRQLKPAQDKLLKMLTLKKGEKVLETAAGTGLVTTRIAKAVGTEGEVVATDLSDEMIERTRSRAKEQDITNVKFHRMDAESLEFEKESFDAAINSFGLMYVPDPVKALQEMNRVLKPGGRAGVAVWGKRKNCGWNEVFSIVDERVASDVCPLFFQQGTGDTLKKSLQRAGFTNISVDRFQVPLYYEDDETALMAVFSGGPVALAYRKFDEKTVEAVHREYLESIKPYRNEKGYHIPGEFVVAKGFK